MKRIRLTHFTSDESRYVITLGNSAHHVFKSRKHLDKFLAKTNKFLTEKLNELNFLYIDIFSIHRRNWTYFLHDKKNCSANNYDSDRKCNEFIAHISYLLEKAHLRSHHKSGPVMVFKDLFNVIDYSIQTLILIRTMIKDKSIKSSIDEINFKIKAVNLIKSELQEYSLDKCTKIVNIQRQIDLFEMPETYMKIAN
jgi:hypothetical protein